eukprot:CAMPEP_0171593698 /NCGR_PEP_ID=MMETSP0990-20121206/266_1 /TAXON_ID=483369 /ORGANISM="non described non described, Strain CCMP2098" /LENGTH=45 /DNA_ID= /DNA_START= /DNA_END= /DNA_ORIENTATION=
MCQQELRARQASGNWAELNCYVKGCLAKMVDTIYLHIFSLRAFEN